MAPHDYSHEKADTEQCAKYSNKRVRELTGIPVWGDAWTRTNNNVLKIVSGYDGTAKPTTWNPADVKDYTFNAANNLKRVMTRKDKKALQDGDIVGMFFRTSPNWQKAYTEGANGETQTHTGHIVKDGRQIYVEHNIHGNVVKNKLDDVLGSKGNPWGVVSIYRVVK